MLKFCWLILSMFCLGFDSVAKADEQFDRWMQELKQDAELQGISSIVVDEIIKDAKLLPQVVNLDRAQPEFITPFLRYVEKRVTPIQVARGVEMQVKYVDLLNDVEQQYHVPQAVLLAFWGMETNYGALKGGFNIPSALVTLAYDGRRATFFRNQLLDAMRIIEAGHVTQKDMRGSWAGAMGHMQFMPSTFLKYGIDANADGRIDLWRSVPDAFASAANYLSTVGWRYDEPIAVQVWLPEGFPVHEAQLQQKKTIAEWESLNVVRVNGEALPKVDGKASIVLPQGWQGPAFMVFDNFETVMDWNKSVHYALAVALLAQQIQGEQGIEVTDHVENGALTFKEMYTLQQNLNARGFNAGKPDGFPGVQTQIAIRQYQLSHGLKADGYASPSIYRHISDDINLLAGQGNY